MHVAGTLSNQQTNKPKAPAVRLRHPAPFTIWVGLVQRCLSASWTAGRSTPGRLFSSDTPPPPPQPSPHLPSPHHHLPNNNSTQHNNHTHHPTNISGKTSPTFRDPGGAGSKIRVCISEGRAEYTGRMISSGTSGPSAFIRSYRISQAVSISSWPVRNSNTSPGISSPSSSSSTSSGSHRPGQSLPGQSSVKSGFHIA